MSLVAGSCAGDRGGAILAEGSGTLELENIVLDTNTAYKGGAIYCDSTFLKLTNVILSRNTAQYGGAISLSNADNRFEHVTLSGNNSPYGHGGGIFADNCHAEWNDVIFTGNRASQGGGLYIKNSFDNEGYDISFTGNQASGYGGAIYISGCYGMLSNMTLLQNKAKYGGAFRIGSSNFSLSNLLLAENETMQIGRGSAVYVSNSNLELNLVTIAGNINSAENNGYLYSDRSEVVLSNSVCWGNEPSMITIVNPASVLEVVNCDIQGGQEGINITGGTLHWLEGNIDADPLFEGSGDHPYQLLPSSPCIDAGMPDTTGMNIPFWDLMGNYRLWDGDSDGDTIVDMGAYEFGSVGVGTEEFKVQSSKFKIEVYPNPASEVVVVSIGSWQLAVGSQVKLSICDLYGREIRTLEDVVNSPGEYKVRIDVSGLPAGVYLVRLQTEGQSTVRKLVIE
jgi:predicted outer membrane repeat protein